MRSLVRTRRMRKLEEKIRRREEPRVTIELVWREAGVHYEEEEEEEGVEWAELFEQEEENVDPEVDAAGREARATEKG